MIKKYEGYFNYYLELEQDFYLTEQYVTIDKDNFNTFSIRYIRIFQSICSEIDCLMKEICRQLDSESKDDNIRSYYTMFEQHFKYIKEESVYFYKGQIELQPFNNWDKDNSPIWWKYYNKIKHHRMEKCKTTNRYYYKYANLENILNSLAALYIIEQYYIYTYDFSSEIFYTSESHHNTSISEDEIRKHKSSALIRYISKKCTMKVWQDKGCYMGFMGQPFFDLTELDKLMEKRDL